MTFEELGLAEPILSAVADKGYTEPSPIQAEAIPAVLTGRDLMAAAQTGTGKTAGFTLPMLHLLHEGGNPHPHRIRALVVTPTRELAAQVAESIETYGKHLPFKKAVVFGGVKINPQITKLRQGIDILVATPGRLLDLHQQGEVDFKALEILVLDEADRMLDMGFIHDIKRLLKLLPAKRQNLLFSATFAPDIRALAQSLLVNPQEVSVSPTNATAESVEQWVYPVDKKRKPAALRELIWDNNWQQVLVFSRTKHGANRLAHYLQNSDINAAAIHGNKSQGARTRALAGFKAGKVRVLVATDIAARGLDIEQLPQVVNVDLPNVPEDYVHRIGRTGRAGQTGKAFSLVSADEAKQLNDIEQLIQKHLKRDYIDGFEPEHELPESRALRAPRGAQKQGGQKQGGQRRGGSQGDAGNARSKSGGRGRNRKRGASGQGSGQGRSQSSGDGGGNRSGNSGGNSNGNTSGNSNRSGNRGGNAGSKNSGSAGSKNNGNSGSKNSGNTQGRPNGPKRRRRSPRAGGNTA